MISDIAIIEVNKRLDDCDSYLLTGAEIKRINVIEAIDAYQVALDVLMFRAKSDVRSNAQIETLVALARLDGVILQKEKVPIPKVLMPIYCGSF